MKCNLFLKFPYGSLRINALYLIQHLYTIQSRLYLCKHHVSNGKLSISNLHVLTNNKRILSSIIFYKPNNCTNLFTTQCLSIQPTTGLQYPSIPKSQVLLFFSVSLIFFNNLSSLLLQLISCYVIESFELTNVSLSSLFKSWIDSR